MLAIVLFVGGGFASALIIKGRSADFFVAGRSLPLWVFTTTLTSQHIDSNAILGAATLLYRFHIWDGAMLLLELGLSLLLNSVSLATFINEDDDKHLYHIRSSKDEVYVKEWREDKNKEEDKEECDDQEEEDKERT